MTNLWLYHGNNINTKINQNYHGKKDQLIEFKNTHYNFFKDSLMAIEGKDINSTKKKVDILNNYYKKVEEFESKHNISSQSKFRSTVLEEFNGYLFKDIDKIDELGLDFYNKNIYAGMKIDTKGNMSIITKDVDFCIGKKFSLKLENKKLDLIIPIVAIEVKTYLDATMFNEVQFSMQIIKNATPNVKTYILMERNEVKKDKILSSKSSSPLDEIFVIRGSVDNEIDYKTVYEFYEEVHSVIDSNLSTNVQIPGRLFNPSNTTRKS